MHLGTFDTDKKASERNTSRKIASTQKPLRFQRSLTVQDVPDKRNDDKVGDKCIGILKRDTEDLENNKQGRLLIW
jgi:hypothetical protein